MRHDGPSLAKPHANPPVCVRVSSHPGQLWPAPSRRVDRVVSRLAIEGGDPCEQA